MKVNDLHYYAQAVKRPEGIVHVPVDTTKIRLMVCSVAYDELELAISHMEFDESTLLNEVIDGEYHTVNKDYFVDIIKKLSVVNFELFGWNKISMDWEIEDGLLYVYDGIALYIPYTDMPKYHYC